MIASADSTATEVSLKLHRETQEKMQDLPHQKQARSPVSELKGIYLFIRWMPSRSFTQTRVFIVRLTHTALYLYHSLSDRSDLILLSNTKVNLSTTLLSCLTSRFHKAFKKNFKKLFLFSIKTYGLCTIVPLNPFVTLAC